MPRRMTLAVVVLALAAAPGPGAAPLVEQQKLVASDGAAFDEFGSRVAVDGDTAPPTSSRGAARCGPNRRS